MSEEKFADNAAKLYTSQEMWEKCTAKGGAILEDRFSENVGTELVQEVASLVIDPDGVALMRQQDPVGAVLWHSQFKSTEYFSKWLEMKESQAS